MNGFRKKHTLTGKKKGYDMANWKNNGKIKLMIIVGTRPEIIRLAAVIKKARKYFDTLLVHTGQNYDYTLNGVFFKDLELDDPDVYLDAVGADLGETMGNIIAKSYQLMVEMKPDAVLVLGAGRAAGEGSLFSYSASQRFLLHDYAAAR